MSDLIKQVGGIVEAKKIVNNHAKCYMPKVFKYWSRELNDYVLGSKYATTSIVDLRQAIADYNTDHCINIENHISPSTKVIER